MKLELTRHHIFVAKQVKLVTDLVQKDQIRKDSYLLKIIKANIDTFEHRHVNNTLNIAAKFAELMKHVIFLHACIGMKQVWVTGSMGIDISR